MSNYIYIATSIDGYIATNDGGLDWLNNIPNPDNNDYGFYDFMNKVDAIVMGRNTFETVLGFGVVWPYPKKVFVLSNKLKEIPSELSDKVDIISGDAKSVNTQLNSNGYNNLYIDGGKTIQSFLKAGLIDEMIITRVPILLGRGIPLFNEMDLSITFEETKTEVLNDYLVKSYYKRPKNKV